jgi:hypothetical protein
MSDAHYKIRADGFEEFIEIGKNVIYLEGEKRVTKGQNKLKRLLRAVRSEDPNNTMISEDVQTLLHLDLAHRSFTSTQKRMIEEEATYIFANKEPRDRLNSIKLRMANLNCNPVARIRSRTVRPSGRQVTNASHFDVDRQPSRVLICKDARVTLNGYNPDPKNGLFHGSLGIVRDIVYNAGESPNDGDFPAYVLVEFHQYCGKPLFQEFPRCIPIVPHEVRCNFLCCVRTYMPLALAYGKTAHTFQGQSVGPVPPGRPKNAIQKIIVDPGKREFEGNNVGLFYQLLSRATTIGDDADKMSSAIYFHGQNFSERRFQNLTMKSNKEMYRKAALRKQWVEFLRDNETPRGRWTPKKMEKIFSWAENTTFDDKDLNNIIANRPSYI